MTSRNSCNSQLFFKTIKQNKAFIILHTIILFLCTLVPAIMSKPIYCDLEVYQQVSISEYLLFDYVELLSFVAMVAAFFAAFFVFSYLFRKDSTVMMHAFPLTRTRLYFSRFGAAAVMLLVSPVVVFFVNLLMNTLWGCGTYYYIGQAFINVLIILSHYVIYLAIFSFAAVLSCHFFSYLTMSLFVMFVIPLTEVIVFGNFTEWFPTWSYDPSNWIFIVCPFAVSLDEASMLFLPENFLYGAACFALGFLALKKRKSENGNGFLGFPKWQNVFKYYLTFMAAFGVGVLFHMGNDFIGDIWYFIAAFLAFVLLQGVFERSLSGMFRNMKKLILVGVVILCVLIVGEADPFGIDDFVFPRSLTSSITITDMYMSDSRLVDMMGDFDIQDEKGVDMFYALLEERVQSRDKEENGNMYVYFSANGVDCLHKRVYVPEASMKEYLEYIYDETDFRTTYIDKLKKISYDYIHPHKNYLMSWDDFSDREMKEFVDLYTEELKKCSFEELENAPLYAYVNANGYDKERQHSHFELTVLQSFENSASYLSQRARTEYYDALQIGGVYIEDRALCKEIMEHTNSYWYYRDAEKSLAELTVYAVNIENEVYENQREVGVIAPSELPENIRMQLQMGPMPSN